jgi:hypothetical protein
MMVRLPYNNYTESCVIDAAGRWRKRNVWYPGRSARDALREVTIVQGNEAMLNAQKSAEVVVGMCPKKDSAQSKSVHVNY